MEASGATQTPAMHAPIEHAVPSGAGASLHPPASSEHVAATWHSSGAGHVTGFPLQTPDLHVSPVVQESPSSHAVPSSNENARQSWVCSGAQPSTNRHAVEGGHWRVDLGVQTPA